MIYFLMANSLSAQIRGKIIDTQTDSPIPYATIVDEAGKLLTLSGPGGEFQLKLQEEDSIKITISHLGYKKKEFILTRGNYYALPLETDLNQIGEVVIRATRFNSSLKSAAGSLTLLPYEMIRNTTSPTINEVINTAPGVFMADGTLSTNRLIIRGVGSRNPYGTNRIRIYFDEFPVNSIDGSSSPENLNPDIIRRIEILKGPSSAIYGSGLGGTIRIIPEYRKKRGFSAQLNNAMHSWSGYESSLSASLGSDNSSLTLAGKIFKTSGYRENNNYNRGDFYLGGQLSGDGYDLKYLLNYLDFDAGIPSSLTREDYINSPESAADSWKQVNGKEKFRNLLAGATFSFRIMEELTASTSVFTNLGNHFESRPFNIYQSEQSGAGIRQSVEFNLSGFKVLGGYEAVYEQSEWDLYQTLSGSRGEKINSLKDKRTYFSSFIHSSLSPLEGLQIEPALSLNFISYQLDDQFNNMEDLSGEYNYAPELSPRLGINLVLDDNLHLYGSAGHGFSPPSLEETLLPEGESNTALKPETGWSFDLGLKGGNSKENLYFDLVAYYMKLSDLLLTKRLTLDQFIGINAGKTRHVGVELFARHQFFKKDITKLNSLFLTASMTYSQNHFVDFVDDGTDYSGNHLPGIPATIFHCSLNYLRMEHWNIIGRYRYYGKQYMNDSNSLVYGGHHLLDLKMAYKNLKITRNIYIELFAGIKNLLNTKYASMILVNAPSFGGSPPRYYYPGNPRNYVAGLKIYFNP